MNAEAATTRSSGGLRRQLVVSALTGVLVPMVIVGGVAFYFLAYQLEILASGLAHSRDAVTHEIAAADLRGQARNAARQLDEFLVERILEGRAWAAADVVVAAARGGSLLHAEQGLTGAPIAEIEDRFRVRKSLGAFPDATRYLRQQIAASPHFAEVFFTDSDGFNVAMTNPTSDFVQSDEAWWTNAWSHGVSVGEVEYDESAGVWSVDISIRIDEPGSNVAIGVMKTVLSIESVQRIADRTAESIPGARVQVATGTGLLIAETSSGHARERIMRPDANIREQGGASIRDAFGPERGGIVSDGQWLSGYARSGGRDAYADAARRFAGFDWIIILQRPIEGIHDRLNALDEIESALGDWRTLLGIGLVVIALACIVLSAGVGAAVAGRICTSLESIREIAERATRGESAPVPDVVLPREIHRLGEAVRRLSLAFLSVRQESRSRPA